MRERDARQATETVDGAQGLTLWAQRCGVDSIDLMITDVLMPPTDGARVSVEWQRTNPSPPITGISGDRRVLSPQFNLKTAPRAGADCQLGMTFTRHDLRSAARAAAATARRWVNDAQGHRPWSRAVAGSTSNRSTL